MPPRVRPDDISQVAINASSGAVVTTVLPARCSGFLLQSRTAVNWRIGFAAGGIVAGNYVSISGANSYSETSGDYGGVSLELRSATGSGHTLELLVWRYSQ